MDPQKIEKVTGHRFEGYTVEMLAMEIDMFRSGAGVGSMTAAVDALKALAQSLAETDGALREELGKLGIAWNSEASGLAQAVFEDSASFAKEAEAKVNNSAQAAFVLSEAFTTLLNKLPDAQTLRDGAKSLSVGDLLANLIGHETDHAAKVRAANAARDQAIDALNEFKSTCGTELAGIDPLGPPETILLDESTSLDPRRPGSDGGFDTLATAGFEVGRGSGGTSSPVSAGTGTGGGVGCPPTSSASGGAVAGGGRSTGSAAAPAGDSTAREPSASDTVAGGAAGAVVGAGAAVVAPRGRSGDPAPGRTPPTAPSAAQRPASGGAVPPGARPGGNAGGQQNQGGSGASGGKVAGPGGLSGMTGGGAVPPGALPGGHGAVAGTPRGEALAAGKLSGVTPPAPSPSTPVGPGVGPQATPGGAGAGVAGGAAAAVGAAGVAGAMGGEQDRERRPRGYGQDTEVDGRPLHDFEVGEISGEQAARNVERIEPPAGEDRPQYLEPAATQEGAGEPARVRSHGVDLFGDQRMVAPEVIGDDPSSAYREDRKGPAQ